MYFERVSWSCENDRKVLFGSLLEGDAQGPAGCCGFHFN
jgi:hypothetical protein